MKNLKLILLGIMATGYIACNKPSTAVLEQTDYKTYEVKEKSIGDIMKNISYVDGIVTFKDYASYMDFKISLNPTNFNEFESAFNKLGHTSYFSITNKILKEVDKYDENYNLDVNEIVFKLEENSKYFEKIEDGFCQKISSGADQIASNTDMIFGIGNKLFFITGDRYSASLKDKNELIEVAKNGNIDTKVTYEATVKYLKNKTRATGSTPGSFIVASSCLSGGTPQKIKVEGNISWQLTTNPFNSTEKFADAVVHICNFRRGRDLGIWGAWHTTSGQTTKWISVTSSGLNGGTQNEVDVIPATPNWNNSAISVFGTLRANWPNGTPLTPQNFWGTGINNATILRGGSSNDNNTDFDVNWSGWNTDFGCGTINIFYPNW